MRLNHVAIHVRNIGEVFLAVGTAVGGGYMHVKLGLAIEV